LPSGVCAQPRAADTAPLVNLNSYTRHITAWRDRVPRMILHHYDFSNYSEKVRLALGLKSFAWQSVIIPAYAPKPTYTPLTAGYRRTPALQIGADVYCDTRLICQMLEELRPQPSLYSANALQRATAEAVSHWAETSVMRPLALYITGINAHRFDADFHRDRAALHKKPQPTPAQVATAGERYRVQFESQWPSLIALLSGPGKFIFGDEARLADFALYEVPWFVRTIGGDQYVPDDAHLRRWAADVAAIGHGEMTEICAADALAQARNAEPRPIAESSRWLETHIEANAEVTITSFDQHTPASGRLLRADVERITIAHESPETGLVHVHFPRLGYRIKINTGLKLESDSN
jgi:glutathione S-transferase